MQGTTNSPTFPLHSFNPFSLNSTTASLTQTLHVNISPVLLETLTLAGTVFTTFSISAFVFPDPDGGGTEQIL
jgi:hypothetical protein